MVIKRREAPELIATTIGRMVRDLYIKPPDRALGGYVAQEMTEPLPLYAFGAKDVDVEFQPNTMKQFGWRSVVTDINGVEGFADVESYDEGTSVEYSKLTQGPLVENMIGAARLVEEEWSGVDAELRVIEAPSIKLSALWLKGERNEFVPFQGAKTEILSEDEFRHLAETLVQESREAYLGAQQEIAATEGGGALLSKNESSSSGSEGAAGA